MIFNVNVADLIERYFEVLEISKSIGNNLRITKKNYAIKIHYTDNYCTTSESKTSRF